MPTSQLSSNAYPLQNANAYAYLIELLSDCTESQRMTQLLATLLTEKEQVELANRVLIFALLQQGLPQREIAERLGVGIATVSRGAKAYQVHHVEKLLPELKEKF